MKPGCHEGVVEKPMKSSENAVSLVNHSIIHKRSGIFISH